MCAFGHTGFHNFTTETFSPSNGLACQTNPIDQGVLELLISSTETPRLNSCTLLWRVGKEATPGLCGGCDAYVCPPWCAHPNVQIEWTTTVCLAPLTRAQLPLPLPPPHHTTIRAGLLLHGSTNRRPGPRHQQLVLQNAFVFCFVYYFSKVFTRVTTVAKALRATGQRVAPLARR